MKNTTSQRETACNSETALDAQVNVKSGRPRRQDCYVWRLNPARDARRYKLAVRRFPVQPHYTLTLLSSTPRSICRASFVSLAAAVIIYPHCRGLL